MSWNNPFNRPNTQQQRQPTQQASQQQQQGRPQNQQMNPQTGAPRVQTSQGQPGTSTEIDPSQQMAETIWGKPPAPANPAQQQQNNQQQQQATPQYDGYTVPWDAGQVGKAVQGVDFMRGMDPELMTRLQGGDWSALNDMMNHVGRQAFTMSAQAAHGFVDRGVKTGLDRFGGTLDDRFRDYEVRGQNPDDALLSSPLNKPVFDSLKSQVARNNPGMTPQQVKETATQWFKDMAAAMHGNQQSQSQSQSQTAETNWAQSLGIEDANGNELVGMPGANAFDGSPVHQQQQDPNSQGNFNNGF